MLFVEVINIEEKVIVSIRMPRDIARQFKAKCAIEGTTGQAVLEKAILDFLVEEKDNPE